MSEFVEDSKSTKKYDSALMTRLLGFVKPYSRYVIIAIVLTIIVAGLGPFRPVLAKYAIDESIANGDYDSLIVISILLFITLIAQAIIQYFLTYYTQYMGQKIIYDLRMKVFNHLQKLALKYFDKTPIGKVVTRVTNDVESLNELFSSGIVMIFSDIFIILWIFAFMFFLSWDLSLVTLSVLPALIYGTFLFKRKARDAYDRVRKYLSSINTFMQEHISGIGIVQIFAKEKDENDNFAKINGQYRKANIDGIFYYAVFYPSVELLSSIALALIIWYGGGNVIQETVTLGVLIAFIQYTEMFFRPIRDLAEKYNIIQSAMASSERVFGLLDNKTIIENPENPKTLENVKGRVDFESVCFAYNEDDYVIKNVSFSIEPGETIAIVGATGAGKTSMINILNRFYDIQHGSIKFDGIDIREVDKDELRNHISIVLQDVVLFSGTIRSNISLDNERINDEQIKKAAETVGANRFIELLPNKYDEEVKERGATLSVGQKQLISFARALVYDPQILILDEATSSVDTETEQIIQEATQKLLVGRTSIVIAHRLSTIQNADKILVMHKGELREMGNHQELLAQKGIYYKLYQLQYKDQELTLS